MSAFLESLGERLAWYWSGGAGGLVGMLVSVSAPLAKSKSCLFDTQNLEQSNLLS